ncbi:glycerate kinase [Corynebacterium sp. LK2510]|uniref:glycerate kinase n=1 Tax=Corynebacterium sp. LK2510 TaxID=3110472 RepID=UPI0034CE4648
MTTTAPETAASPTIVIAGGVLTLDVSADDAAQWLADGLRSVIHDADVVFAPMAGGGPGTSAMFGGETITLPTTDAAGRLTDATYVYDSASATAFIDLAAASGWDRVRDTPVPLTGDTYGTGVLIADAQTRGASRIVLSTGGAATLDGGTGILVALGANPLAPNGRNLVPGATGLAECADLDTAVTNIPAASLDFLVLADAPVAATGDNGAARVYGPHIGASEDEVVRADQGLARLCEVAGVDPSTPGIGAGGAVAVGITWLSSILHGTADHVTVAPGAHVIAQLHDLPALLDRASLVITSGTNGTSSDESVAATVLGLAAARETTAAVIDIAATDAASAADISVQLPTTGDPREELEAAGARIAVDYLRISTVHG